MILKPTDPKEQREEVKNKAIELREQTNFDEALKLFEQVIGWDESNDNENGQVDVLGHIRITYTHMAQNADNARDAEEAKQLRKLAMETAEDALQIKKTPVSVIHSISARLDYAQYLELAEAKQELLNRAHSDLKDVMKDFPGSKAHKAWPANLKAQIEYAMGDSVKAIKTLNKAEKWIFEGYEDEVNGDDQSEMKLKVWSTGLQLTKAKIYTEQNRPILAKIYATAVKEVEDPTGQLNTRKLQAQEILNQLVSPQQ